MKTTELKIDMRVTYKGVEIGTIGSRNEQKYINDPLGGSKWYYKRVIDRETFNGKSCVAVRRYGEAGASFYPIKELQKAE